MVANNISSNVVAGGTLSSPIASSTLSLHTRRAIINGIFRTDLTAENFRARDSGLQAWFSDWFEEQCDAAASQVLAKTHQDLLQLITSLQTAGLATSRQDIANHLRTILPATNVGNERLDASLTLSARIWLSVSIGSLQHFFTPGYLLCWNSDQNLTDALDKGFCPKPQTAGITKLPKVFTASLLVMIFSHGNARTKGVYLGLQLDTGLVDCSLMSMDTFRTAIGCQVRVALLGTACFSGAWAVNPSLNTTTLAAAGWGRDKNNPKYITGESESWIPSVTIGRLSGSIYATAVIKALTAEGNTSVEKDTGSKEIPDSAASVSKQMQMDTYNTFAGTIYRILFNRVDRWAIAHDIQFSAQDDEWSREWHAGTGFPLSHYVSKWSILREVAPDPAAVIHREPTYEEDKSTGETIKGASGSLQIGASGIRGLFNSNLPALRSAVQLQGKMYLTSDPGRDTVASNIALHNAIQRLDKGDFFISDSLEQIQTQIDYRLRAMDLADLFVEALGLCKPSEMKCAEWNWTSAGIIEVGDQ